MKNLNPILLGLMLLVFFGCTAVKKHQKKGIVNPKDFDENIEFTTIKSLIVLPVEINGTSKKFIFDTGADYSLIQRDSTIGKTSKVSGASKRKAVLGREIIKSMKFGSIDFRNTSALNGDLVGLKEQIPNFGGLIGQSIISKANWLIDYPNKKLRISNRNLVDNSFKRIQIKRKNGAPYTYITIDGVKHKVIIDLGSTSEFNLPRESELARQLLEKYKFDNHKRKRYTLGGLQNIDEKVGVIPSIKLGDFEFKEIRTTINVSSQPRIGMAFFKDCKIYIDNINNSYQIKK